MTDGVVQSKETLSEIEIEQQRKVEQLAQKIIGLEILESARRRPEARDDADGNVRVLGKDAEFAEARPLRLGQKVETDADRARDRLGAFGLVARIEGRQTLRVEALVGARDRDRQRLAAFDAIAQEAVDDLEQQRPFAETRGEVREARRARASPDPAAGRPRAGRAPRRPASRRRSGESAFAGRTLSIRVVTSRTQFRPPCRNGRRSGSRQTSSTTMRIRRSPRPRRASPRPR